MAAIEIVETQARAMRARRPSYAVPLYAIGLAGLLQDSWPAAPYLRHLNLHLMFGALLWLLVLAQFRGYASDGGTAFNGVGVHEFTRVLTRRVYLLLYSLFGGSQLVRIAAIAWNSGKQGALHPAVLEAPENLRDYLAYGAFALLTIRVLAAIQCKRSNAPVAQTAQRLPTTSTTNDPAIGAGRGCGCSAVAAGAVAKSAVAR
jgi:hypothetical protein